MAYDKCFYDRLSSEGINRSYFFLIGEKSKCEKIKTNQNAYGYIEEVQGLWHLQVIYALEFYERNFIYCSQVEEFDQSKSLGDCLRP